ncbi:hypothetical protein K492DRAFT_184506 [Lichtheimia hyalospora FSU 10163]|nr:hypothetical protein K492DRAFT_184506 [Lichtheimia hyalospora FSU 10163]
MALNDRVIRWSELLQNPIVTAEHRNGKEQILTATDTLQQTGHHFVRVLSERAKLFANSAQFDTALRDAKAIITILPGSGLGYLCAGDVLCQQGRYATAIVMYDQGLNAVPESDEYYQLLQQHQLTATANNTTASERVLKQPEGLQFNFGTEKETLGKGHAQLVRFAPYVQRLKGEITHVGLEELFTRANFSDLKQLVITSTGNTPRRPLLNGLELIAHSLTHLQIADCYSIQFRDILESCPNLVSITMMSMEAVMPSSSSIRYPKSVSVFIGARDCARSRLQALTSCTQILP